MPRPARRRAAEPRRLVAEIRVIHAESRRTDRSPRVHATLQTQGQRVSPHRVVRRRRAGRIRATTVKKWRATTESAQSYLVVPNPRTRQCAVTKPNRVWAGAITDVWTAEGGRSLAVGLDLSSRRVMAWGGSRLTQAWATAALTMALEHRRPARGSSRTVDPSTPPPGTARYGPVTA